MRLEDKGMAALAPFAMGSASNLNDHSIEQALAVGLKATGREIDVW